MTSALRMLQVVSRCNRSAYNKRLAKRNNLQNRQIQKNGEVTSYDAISGRTIVTSPDGNKYFTSAITTGVIGRRSSISLTDLTRNIPKIDSTPTL